jgi:hypothetical protein
MATLSLSSLWLDLIRPQAERYSGVSSHHAEAGDVAPLADLFVFAPVNRFVFPDRARAQHRQRKLRRTDCAGKLSCHWTDSEPGEESLQDNSETILSRTLATGCFNSSPPVGVCIRPTFRWLAIPRRRFFVHVRADGFEDGNGKWVES